MTLLVTGAGGQLGREWMHFLKEQGVGDVTGLSSGQLDISDREAVRRVLDDIRPDIVINCAAWTDVDGAERDFESAHRVNRDGVVNLAGWCAGHSARMVHYSTDYVFPGRREDRQRYPAGYGEDAETAPVNVYGRSKLAGEQALQRSGADHLLLRVSWLCGAFGTNFVTKILAAGKERGVLDVVDDQLGSPSFADRVVFWSWELIKRRETGTYHITSGGLTSWYELAAEIFNYLELHQVQVRPRSSESVPAVATRPAFSKLDPGRLEQTLGVEMEAWQSGLHRLLNQLTTHSH